MEAFIGSSTLVLLWFAVAAPTVDNNPRLLLSNVVYSGSFGTFTYLHICFYFGYFGCLGWIYQIYWDQSHYQSVFARGLRGRQALYCMHDGRGVDQVRLLAVKSQCFGGDHRQPKDAGRLV